MNPLSPIARISFSLALLSLSIMLTGDLFFGDHGEEERVRMEARRHVSESLAIQVSELIASNDMRILPVFLNKLVARDADVISAALRTVNGRLVAKAGEHEADWKDIPFDKSTLTHTQIPIFKDQARWATVELRFADEQAKSVWQIMSSPFALLAIYTFTAGFIGYVFFMRRTLKHLDPSAVIPDRVKAALDVLTEGVILVDERLQVVLANNAISEKLGLNAESLLGKRLSDLGWYQPESEGNSVSEYPWQSALREGTDQVGTRMKLGSGKTGRTFRVNSSPIFGDTGKSQGVLSTFDDVTELEQKNSQLRHTVAELQTSRDEVSAKNEELVILAERDGLTNCYNRRTFFDRANAQFKKASEGGGPLTVIMLDIDKFKSINDNYGHSAGDEVIKSLANILQQNLRENEVLGRYGGEEFCILLPNTEIGKGDEIAERMRRKVAEGMNKNVPEIKHRITASFGVSSSTGGANSAENLVDQADQALYASKENGRNRVTRWDLL